MYGANTLQELGKKYYLEDIMNSNAIKDQHKCKRYMVLWNFSDLFTCEYTGLYHVCDEWCKVFME
jgi:hypothetical protein